MFTSGVYQLTCLFCLSVYVVDSYDANMYTWYKQIIRYNLCSFVKGLLCYLLGIFVRYMNWLYITLTLTLYIYTPVYWKWITAPKFVSCFFIFVLAHWLYKHNRVEKILAQNVKPVYLFALSYNKYNLQNCFSNLVSEEVYLSSKNKFYQNFNLSD